MHPASGQENLYDILGLPRDATRAEVRHAFLRLAQECHPDLNGSDESAENRFRRIRQAYEVLYDPAARSTYDALQASRAGQAHCHQEWPRSRPIVTTPPTPSSVSWTPHERTEVRWTKGKEGLLAAVGLVVAICVLTIITHTHFREIQRIRRRAMGAPMFTHAMDVQPLHRDNPPAAPKPDTAPPTAPEPDANSPTTVDDEVQVPERQPPSRPVDPVDEVIQSADSLKALRSGGQNTPLGLFAPSWNFIPSIVPQWNMLPSSNAPEEGGTSEFKLPPLSTGSVRPFEFDRPALPERRPREWDLPNGPIPRSLPGSKSLTPSLYDTSLGQDERTIFDHWSAPPKTNSAIPMWQRPASAVPPNGNWTVGSSSTELMTMPPSLSWSAVSSHSTAKTGASSYPANDFSATGLRQSPYSPQPLSPQPLSPLSRPGSSLPSTPTNSYRPTPLSSPLFPATLPSGPLFQRQP